MSQFLFFQFLLVFYWNHTKSILVSYPITNFLKMAQKGDLFMVVTKRTVKVHDIDKHFFLVLKFIQFLFNLNKYFQRVNCQEQHYIKHLISIVSSENYYIL